METLHQGIYGQLVKGQTQVVEGTSTSLAGFVGVLAKGAIGSPIYVTSFPEFMSKCGSFISNSYLAYVIRGFFENGGKRAYISRAVHYTGDAKTSVAASAKIQSTNASPADAILFTAISDGVWANGATGGLSIEVANTTGTGDTATFDFNIYLGSTIAESYKGATYATLEDLVNGVSTYGTVDVLITTDAPKDDKVDLTSGDDGTTGMTDTDYLKALSCFNVLRLNLVAVPGVTTAAVEKGILSFCMEKCFGILEAPKGSTATQAVTFKNVTATLASEDAALYTGWYKVNDPIGVGSSPTKIVPPSGHIAGVIARIDASRGVWKAPGGTEAVVQGILGVDVDYTDADNDILNPNNICCTKTVAGALVLWGARGLNNGEYKYFNKRRAMLYFLQSLTDSFQWTTFEPNDPDLWSSMQTMGESFFKSILKQDKRAFVNYFVKCDKSINDSNSPTTYFDFGVAFADPNEFTVIRGQVNRA